MIKAQNKQFLILQAIAIILVVVGHMYSASSAQNALQIYSYHMALFVFISGYFFKIESVSNIPLFIWGKMKRLVIPYFAWNLVYAIILFVLIKRGVVGDFHGVKYDDIFTVRRFFIQPWIDGYQYILNLAAWFVLILFITQVLYVVIRFFYEKLKVNNEWLLQIVLLLIGFIALFCVNNNVFEGFNEIYRPFVKTLFFLPFYHFGYYYKSKLEKKDTLHNAWYFLILLVIWYFIIVDIPELDYSVVNLGFRGNSFIPFLTSFVGILFWLRVAKNIQKYIGDNKFLEFLGANTWSIMLHHFFVFFLINYLLSKLNLNSFDYNVFRTDVWYSYHPLLPAPVYWILAILIPLLWQYFFDYIKKLFQR